MIRATTGTARLVGAALTLIAIAWTSASQAQEAAPLPPEGTAPAAGTPPPPPPPPAPLPPPPPPVVQQEPPPDLPRKPETDLDAETRRVGIGYAGISQIPVGGPAGTLTAPAISVRAWVKQSWGVDGALGFGYAGGATETNGVRVDRDPVTGVIFQLGFPVNLAVRRHVAFQVIPQAGFAYGQTTMSSGVVGIPGIDFSGLRVNAGVRSGFELFWGFIGLPELSLSATVGLQYEFVMLTMKDGTLESTETSYGLATTVQNSPWDIFTGNVAARYYF